MKRHKQSTRNGGGRPRGRIATKAVALIATFALVMSMCPGTAALAYANGQIAGDPAGNALSASAPSSLDVQSGEPSVRVNKLLRADDNGVAHSDGTCLRPGNLTISGYGASGEAIKSAVVVARNALQIKVLSASGYTVQDGSGSPVSSGGTAGNGVVAVKFGEGVSMAAAQAWLRENLVITPEVGQACEVEVSVSDEDLTAAPTTSNEQSQPEEAMKKLTGGKNVGLDSGRYYVSEDVEFTGQDAYIGHNEGGWTSVRHNARSGLFLWNNQKVLIYIMEGKTLKAVGGTGRGISCSASGIYAGQSTALCLAGKGTVIARGGDASDGGPGGNDYRGTGGDGAGAGIGTDGGEGGDVGAKGEPSRQAGTICILDGVTRDIKGGKGGKAGADYPGGGCGGGAGGAGADCGRGGCGGNGGGWSAWGGKTGADGEGFEGVDESVSTTGDFSLDYAVTFDGAAGGGRFDYSLGEAKTITVPEPGDASGKIFFGWQVTHYGRSLVTSDAPLTTAEQRYRQPGRIIELPDDTYGDITLTAIMKDKVGNTSTGESSMAVPPVSAGTHRMASGTYYVAGDTTIGPDSTGNAIQVEKGANVVLNIEEGATLTVTGKDASGNGNGYAAILVPEGSTLTIAGGGTLNATGGKAGNGAKGGNADGSSANRTGNGGRGGQGGGGAGAGIGADGGAGGAGGAGGEGVSCKDDTTSNEYGNNGSSGSAGSPAESAGTVFIVGSTTVNAKGGASGSGGKGGSRGRYVETRNTWDAHAACTSGGGGGGAGGSAADGIGSGGSGGGGGGGGASGNIDGECAVIEACDLDDLWSYGGSGGSSAWGGGNGGGGDYGASNEGDSNSGYAKSGGNGGACPVPRTVSFYTYAGGSSSGPKVTCTAGNGTTRSGTALSSEDAQSKGVAALGTQSESGSWAETVDGAEVTYDWEIAYFDGSGTELESEPTEPGSYTVKVSIRGSNGDSDTWSVPYTVKRRVDAPAPSALVFQCENWDNGAGVEQDAFEGLDESVYEFVPGAKAADGSESLETAKSVGKYEACFKLKDPEACEWAIEAGGDGEVWVPWSIEAQEYDPNSSEITYWGTAYDNDVTTVDYTGEPVWVRPWFTPAESIGGEFPDWFTHWGGEGRPTTDRRSSVVVYLQGADDDEGLVGYHTNADGSLEKVTAEQVYVWVNGVDVDGEHVAVEAGDKVWYKRGEDGWKVPLAVQDDEPEGAEGYVVARDYAYADRLGVMEPGEYRAYAAFDDGAGFAATSLAETTVVVKPADATKVAAATPKTGTDSKASASATPKTGDFSPFVVGGIALVGLLAVGGIALSLARRRR